MTAAKLRQAEQPVLPGRRRRRRADHQGPDVLLVRHRELSRRADAQRRGAHADGGRARRRLLGADQRAGQPVIIYDPLTSLPFPGNVIPANRINPVAAAMLKYLPLPDINVDNGSDNYNRTSLINNNFETEIHGQGRAQVHRQGVVDRLLPVQPDQRAVRRTTSAPPTRPSRTASPTRWTTSWCAGRRCWR